MNAETQQSIRRAPAPVLVSPASFALAGAGSAPRPHTADAAPRVVIVGAGFAGLTAAQALKGAPVQVILIDRRNHHLFQPLLYQVATAACRRPMLRYPHAAFSGGSTARKRCSAKSPVSIRRRARFLSAIAA